MNKRTYTVIESRTANSCITLTEHKDSIEIDIDTLKAIKNFSISLPDLQILKKVIDEFLKPTQQDYEEDWAR